MDAISRIAEAKIRDAIERGEFDDLPGSGRPLELEKDAGIPPHLRLAYKVLRNAEILPPEMESRREIYRLDRLIANTDDESELADLRRRRIRSELQFNILMERRLGSLASTRSPPPLPSRSARRHLPRQFSPRAPRRLPLGGPASFDSFPVSSGRGATSGGLPGLLASGAAGR